MGRIQVHPMSVCPAPDGAVFSAPYTLGCLIAYSKAHREGRLNEHFDFQAITPRYHEEGGTTLDDLREPGVFLFSSYVWNHDANLRVARRIKDRIPGALVIFGGPQVPKQKLPLRAFFLENSCVDMVVRGEGEEALSEILETIAAARTPIDSVGSMDFSHVPGIAYRAPDFVETADRPRAKSLESYPSPYTAGLFDHWISATGYMPLETNRGCPYGCTFCDWGAATLQKIRVMSMERVFGEIEYAGRFRISSVYICDANFGILKRDVEIAAHIVEISRRFGYPRLVGYNNAKVIRPELQQIVKMLRDAGLNALGQVAIQTTDPTTLSNVKRSNIKVSEYDKLVHFFREENIPAVSELMLGLPGQTLRTTQGDLQFLFDRHIYARVFATFVMPNAPMNEPEYKALHEIEVDAAGHVSSTSSFTSDDLERMFDLCYAFKLLAGLATGIFKYLLLFLQADRNVPAVEYVRRWLARVSANASEYPVSHRLWENVLAKRRDSRWKDTLLLIWSDAEGAMVLGDLDELLREALEVARAEFDVDVGGSDVDSIVAAQRAVLPSPANGPRTIELVHDVSTYIGTLTALVNVSERGESFKPLSAYGPGTLTIHEDRRTLAYNDYGAPFQRLELRSSLFN